MSLTVEDAQFVSNMRMQMLKNIQAGKTAQSGIDEDKLREALAKVRKTRSLGDTTGSKAKAKAPVIPMDLDSFMQKPVKE